MTIIIKVGDNEISVAEIHWFEANGIGQRDHKAVRDLKRLK